MNTETSTITTQNIYPPIIADEKIYYPSTVENYMPEGIVHFLLNVQIALTLITHFADRKNVKVFGDLMLYYNQGNPKKFISPDIMVCFDLEKAPTKVYKLWEEKVVPSVVIEVASESTWKDDLYRKYDLYEQLGVKEYYIYDVERSHMPQPLFAFYLRNGKFETVQIKDSRGFSESLNLELVDTGETLRLFNPQTNEFLMTMEEMAKKLAQLEKSND